MNAQTAISTVREPDLSALLPLTAAARIGTMNDLYVAPAGRVAGVAEELIRACVERCRERGAVRLGWQTALDNLRAQAVYERVGGKREQWVDYSLPT